MGQPAISHWGAVRGLPDHPEVGDFDETLDQAGIREGATNAGFDGVDLDALQYRVSAAVDVATAHIRDRRDDFESDLLRRIDDYRRGLKGWEQTALGIVTDSGRRTGSRLQIEATVDESSALIEALAASGDPFVRVVAVIVPKAGS